MELCVLEIESLLIAVVWLSSSIKEISSRSAHESTEKCATRHQLGCTTTESYQTEFNECVPQLVFVSTPTHRKAAFQRKICKQFESPITTNASRHESSTRRQTRIHLRKLVQEFVENWPEWKTKTKRKSSADKLLLPIKRFVYARN